MKTKIFESRSKIFDPDSVVRWLVASILLLVLFLIVVILDAYAGEYNAIIYANKRNPVVTAEAREHWKTFIPDLGTGEVIRDFYVLERNATKIVVHALVDTRNGEDGQVKRIKDYIRTLNGCVAPTLQGPTCSTPVGQQVLAWWGRTAEEAYTKLWQSRSTHAVFETIAKGVLRYPVTTTCDGQPCTLVVSVVEAETTHGETIEAQKLMIPHRFSGR